MRTSVSALVASVRELFLEHASSFGLDPQSIAVHYVWNPGGFVNHSFRITDGGRCLHLKLATTDYGHQELRRWQQLSGLLQRYRAPAVLDWVDVQSAGGLLFECLRGSPPRLTAEVLNEVLAVMHRLNNDAQLVRALQPHSARTMRDIYFATYHDRFTEDLKFIRESPPPFVTRDLLEWLNAEAEQLARMVVDSSAFSQAATQPVHSDLWLNNILWHSVDDWHIVDWDGIALGDPMIDLAMLIGPADDDVKPLKMYDRVAASLSEMERARLPILGRASLLDWIIDPLSDWIDANVAPAHTQQTRALKQRAHHAALALYRQMY